MKILTYPPEWEKGPIFAAKFSKSGRWLLTASLDGSACVWDVQAKKLEQQFKAHDGPQWLLLI